MDPSAERFLELSRFWVQRVLVPILVLIGAGGNIVTVMVLTRRRMRCSTNIYLTALAVADLIYLLFVLILSFEHYPNINDIRYELYWRFYGINHWFADAASSTSIWLTVSFTVERYIAVCHPIRGKVLCTEKRAKRVIAAVSLICILATASTSFEYQLTTSEFCAQKVCEQTPKQLEKEALILDKHPQLVSHEDLKFSVDNLTLNKDVINLPDASVIDNESTYGHTENSTLNWVELTLASNDNEFGIKQDYLNESDQQDSSSKQLSPFNIILKEMDKAVKDRLPLRDCGNIEENSTVVPTDTGQNCMNTTHCEEINLNTSLRCVNLSLTKVPSIDLEVYNASDCCLKKVIIKTEPTQLGKNTTYRTIFYWFSSVSFAFLPLILIATINCFLVNAVRKSQKERKKMTKSQENSSQAQENKMTVILISVVILFLICQTPTACLLIYTSVYPSADTYSDNIVRGLGNVFNLLVSINAACNFLLYCALSEKYRRTFKALFCEKRMNRQDTYTVSTSLLSHRLNNQRNGCKRNVSAYLPRNLETQSLTSIPRAKSMITRPIGQKDNLKV